MAELNPGAVPQPAAPPIPAATSTDAQPRVRVQRSGSLRPPPPDRTEIPEATAEDSIARLLNPRLAKAERRAEREQDADESDDAPVERPRESEQVRAEREEAAEQKPEQPAEQPDDDGELSLDDTPVAKPAVEGDDALEEITYTAPNGKVYAIPKEIVDGAMRQDHFTKATTEAAAERRYNATLRQNLETDGAINAELAPAVSQIQQLSEHIKQLSLQKNQPTTTMEQFIQYTRQIDSLTDTLNEYRGAVDSRRTELSAQKQAVVAALQGAADDYLSKSLPKWNPPVKAAVFQHFLDSGFTHDEVNMMYDPRVIRMAHDAALLKKLQSKRQATVKQVQQAAPVVRPTGRANNASTEAQQAGRLKAQAQRSGKESDAISALDRLLKNSRNRS